MVNTKLLGNLNQFPSFSNITVYVVLKKVNVQIYKRRTRPRTSYNDCFRRTYNPKFIDTCFSTWYR